MFRIRHSLTSLEHPDLEAYRTVYGNSIGFNQQYPSKSKRMFRGLYVDISIKDSVIDQLMNIDNITIKYISQVNNSNLPTYFIFRPSNQKSESIDKLIELLNTGQTKATSYTGNGGMFNICVATRNWYRDGADNSAWDKWWDSIPKLIKTSISKV